MYQLLLLRCAPPFSNLTEARCLYAIQGKLNSRSSFLLSWLYVTQYQAEAILIQCLCSSKRERDA